MANRFKGSYRTFAERPVIRWEGRTPIYGPAFFGVNSNSWASCCPPKGQLNV